MCKTHVQMSSQRSFGILVFLAGLFSFSFLLAQPNVNWGPSYKVKGSSEVYKFLGILGDSYYFVQKPNDDNIVQRFNFKHELVSETKYKYVRNRERIKIHGGIETRSGFFIYSHQLSEKYKEWILHVSEIRDGKITEPAEAYFQQIDIESARLRKAYRSFEYDFGDVDGGLVISEDSSKVAFVNIIPGNDFRDEDAVAVAVFDDRLQLIWKELFYFKFSEKRYDIEQSVVSNDGEIYLVGKLDDPVDYDGKIKSMREKNLPRFEYYLYHINQDGILPFKVDLGKREAPMDVALFFPDRETDQFLVAGFFTDDEHRFRQKGIFFAYGDKHFSSTSYKKHYFSEDFLAGLVSNKAIEKGKGLESTYQIMDILNYQDGTIGFIAENNYVRDLSQTDIYGRWFERIIYVSDEIIIPRFRTDGSLINIEKIPKNFDSELPQYTSYAMAIHNGLTYLIFNDYKSGEERKETGKKGRRFTDLVVIGRNGQFLGYETIFTEREIELEFNPRLCDFNKDFFLIGSKRGNRFSMATLQFVPDR